MKRTLFLMVIVMCLFSNVHAQTNYKAGFNISLPDQSSNSVFDLHPDLDYFYITYKDGEAATLYSYSLTRQKSYQVKEIFYLAFEGDRYLLNKKYPKLKVPKYATLKMTHLLGIKKLRDSSTRYDLSTTLRRDSITYQFNFYIKSPGEYVYPGRDANMRIILSFNPKGKDTVYTLHPKFKGDVSLLQNKLGQSFKKWRPIAVRDSVLLITGVVETNGSLGNLKLESTEQSPFSDKVLEFIAQEATIWWPRAVNTIKKVRQQTKFFVRLQSDNSIILSIL